jgi:antitoxin component YwqK of YwqJK toxin-antitoxin module
VLVNEVDTVLDRGVWLLHEGERFTGEVVATDAEGRVVGLTSYAHGVEHGPQVEWYPDGTKKSEGVTDEGNAVGEWREWHPNGQLAQYDLLDEHGDPLRAQRWDESGELTSEHVRDPSRG